MADSAIEALQGAYFDGVPVPTTKSGLPNYAKGLKALAEYIDAVETRLDDQDLAAKLADLDEMKEAIERLGDRLTGVEDKAYQSLEADTRRLTDRLDQVQQTLRSVEARLDDVERTVDDVGATADRAEQKAGDTDRVLGDLIKALDDRGILSEDPTWTTPDTPDQEDLSETGGLEPVPGQEGLRPEQIKAVVRKCLGDSPARVSHLDEIGDTGDVLLVCDFYPLVVNPSLRCTVPVEEPNYIGARRMANRIQQRLLETHAQMDPEDLSLRTEEPTGTDEQERLAERPYQDLEDVKEEADRHEGLIDLVMAVYPDAEASARGGHARDGIDIRLDGTEFYVAPTLHVAEKGEEAFLHDSTAATAIQEALTYADLHTTLFAGSPQDKQSDEQS